MDDFKPQLDAEDFYKTEDGYIVFTEKYHLKRGFCCLSGCKHCPYGYDPKTGKFDEEKKKSVMEKLKNLFGKNK